MNNLDTLQKIKEEIEKLPIDYYNGYVIVDKRKVLAIIDKYERKPNIPINVGGMEFI